MAGFLLFIPSRRDPALLAVYTMDAPPTTVAISADGMHFAAASSTGIITVWDRMREQPIQWHLAPQRQITDLLFRPDGTTLISSDTEGNVQLWDVTKGVLIRSLGTIATDTNIQSLSNNGLLHLPLNGMVSLAVSPDGTVVAVGGTDGHILIVDTNTGALLHHMQGHPIADSPGNFSEVLQLAFNEDGKKLASGAFDGSIVLWDPMLGEVITTLVNSSEAEYIQALAFQPNRQTLAFFDVSADYEVRTLRNGQRMLSGRIEEYNAPALTFMPDGITYVRGGEDVSDRVVVPDLFRKSIDTKIYIERIADQRPIRLQVLDHHKSRISDVAVSHNGRFVVSASFDDRMICLWKVID